MTTRTGLGRQAATFAIVGVAGTVAYLAVYLVLRHGMDAHLANVTARVTAVIPTTWINGRRTFGSDASWRRICGGALVVLAVGTAISAVPLAIEQLVLGPDDRPAEVLTLIGANALATVARFLLLRNWLFRSPAGPRRPAGAPQRGVAPTSPTIQPAGS